jgi:putative N6-adenine-specific DNA methylase
MWKNIKIKLDINGYALGGLPVDHFENIEKRIKRHVIGKSHIFYVSTLPGFEQMCLDELSGLGVSVTDAKIDTGGVEFSGKVHECYFANIHLRTGNRILMRVDSFRATNFRQLGERAAQIPWELYLYNNSDVGIHVSSRHSRLIHTDAISERIREGIDKRPLLARPDSDTHPVDKYPQQIFIRAVDDRFTVSLDSSGELLHKRGFKINVGKAPLRETIAAAILRTAGYDPEKPLVDPMCGAGTFSLEAAMMANRIPAGWFREFAFMGWPCFRQSRWRHIRREAAKTITQLETPVIFASDKDPGVCREVENTVQTYNLCGTMRVFERDFFELSPQDIQIPGCEQTKGLVVINPPYGRRLGTKAQSAKLFDEIFLKLKKDFKGWRFALIVPDKQSAGKIPFKADRYEIFHGGLKLMLLVGRI